MTKTLDLAWQNQEKIPTLITGRDAKKMYDALPEQARVGLKYDKESQTIIGSTPFATAVLDVVAQEYGARTPNLKDLSRPEVMRIAKGSHYIDSRNLVVRSHTDSYWPQNNSLLKQIYELAEEKEGSVRDGFMIENFTFVPDESDAAGYGLKIVPFDDFRVVQDERFDGTHNGKKFSEVDGKSIPIFYANGNRTWFARKEGLSRLCLDRDLNLYSGNNDLADSYGNGRVVLLK